MVGIPGDPGVPSISNIGSIGTVSGIVDIMYDGINEFIGIRDEGGNFMIFNMDETNQLIEHLRVAQSLTQEGNSGNV